MRLSGLVRRSLGGALFLTLLIGPATAGDEGATRGVAVRRLPSGALAGKVEGQDCEFGTYHALLIGISKYEDPGVDDLVSPGHDVDELERVLRANYGFADIKVLKDEKATRSGILRTLRGYQKLLGKNSNLLIYYAGHGIQVKDAEGLPSAYWVPYDGEATADAQDSWVWSKKITQIVAGIPAKHVLIVSDSCYSGAMRDAKPVAKTRPPQYILESYRMSSRALISSGANEPVPDTGKGRLSFFAYHLTSILESNPFAFSTAEELHIWLKRTVPEDNPDGQTPQYGGLQGAGHQYGSFVFVKLGEVDQVSAPPPEEGLPAGYSRPTGIERKAGEKGVFVDTGRDSCEMVLAWEGIYDRDGKKHKIAPFLIDRYEVTVERFERFINAWGVPEGLRHWNSPGYSANDQPVVGVSYENAKLFAKWAGKQLPTEVEWEWAAGWDREREHWRTYPWGDSFKLTGVPPASKPPVIGLAREFGDISPSGAFGMGSGVREWCDPVIRGGAHGVIRGASQIIIGRRDSLRQTIRTRSQPRTEFRSKDLGFRCILYLTK